VRTSGLASPRLSSHGPEDSGTGFESLPVVSRCRFNDRCGHLRWPSGCLALDRTPTLFFPPYPNRKGEGQHQQPVVTRSLPDIQNAGPPGGVWSLACDVKIQGFFPRVEKGNSGGHWNHGRLTEVRRYNVIPNPTEERPAREPQDEPPSRPRGPQLHARIALKRLGEDHLQPARHSTRLTDWQVSEKVGPPRGSASVAYNPPHCHPPSPARSPWSEDSFPELTLRYLVGPRSRRTAWQADPPPRACGPFHPVPPARPACPGVRTRRGPALEVPRLPPRPGVPTSSQITLLGVCPGRTLPVNQDKATLESQGGPPRPAYLFQRPRFPFLSASRPVACAKPSPGGLGERRPRHPAPSIPLPLSFSPRTRLPDVEAG